MIFNESELAALRIEIKSFMGKKRYDHTLGVEKEAINLGNYFGYDISELRAAALLHDIAKEKSVDEQCELIRDGGVNLTDEDLKTPSVLHSLAGVGAIKKYFPKFSTQNILSSIFAHTTAKPDMTFFDAIIFIADFIEEGREYRACQNMRSSIYFDLQNAKKSENHKIIEEYLLKIIDFTIDYLNKNKKDVNSRLLTARYDILTNHLHL